MNFLNILMGYLSDVLYIVPVVLISLSFHELAHGYIAYKMGDPTAKQSGRLTLNPLKHLDPVGLLFMIIFRFGWAKPVPVSPLYFKNPRRGMLYTAIAGPASNLILAVPSIFFTLFFQYAGENADHIIFEILFTFFLYMSLINLGLAVFNFIPVYPLDGSRILGYFMPRSFNDFFVRYGNYIYIAFIVLAMVTDVISTVVSTVQIFLFNIFAYLLSYPAFGIAELIF